MLVAGECVSSFSDFKHGPLCTFSGFFFPYICLPATIFMGPVTGTLKGYDQLLNLVLDEAVEYERGTV